MKHKHISSSMGLIAVIVSFLIPMNKVLANPIAPAGDRPGVADENCLACHDSPGLQTELASGEILYLSVDRITHVTSVHGRNGFACVQCHTDIRGFPHPELTTATRREYTLQMYTACKECHESNYEASLDSTHQRALAGGNENAAVCTDCHGVHDISEPAPPRSNIPKMCERCHSEIYNAYAESVHGSDLIGEGDPFVPTCIDCHGVHNVTGPEASETFHLFSPQICAQCHADEALMDRYGISTQVFDTYVADFHGTTVVLFEKITPDQETNKPVCINCHGVHDMRKVDDPESRVIQENLLDTCQKCHPSANTNFPTSWLGHYKPSPDEAPLVYFVDIFYKIIIPVTIGGMVVFIGADVIHKISKKRGERK